MTLKVPTSWEIQERPEILVTDINGRLMSVNTSWFSEKSCIISVASLADGLYFAIVKTKYKSQAVKFVVKH